MSLNIVRQQLENLEKSSQGTQNSKRKKKVLKHKTLLELRKKEQAKQQVTNYNQQLLRIMDSKFTSKKVTNYLRYKGEKDVIEATKKALLKRKRDRGEEDKLKQQKMREGLAVKTFMGRKKSKREEEEEEEEKEKEKLLEELFPTHNPFNVDTEKEEESEDEES